MFMITSSDFEIAAKNAVIEVLDKKHNLKGITIEDLQFVWFAHILGDKKCLIYSPKMYEFYAEVTFSVDSGQTYVDIYEKKSNTCFKAEELDFSTDISKTENEDE